MPRSFFSIAWHNSEMRKKGWSAHCLNAQEVDLLTGNIYISRDLHQALKKMGEMTYIT
jgi:hypothetical protein